MGMRQKSTGPIETTMSNTQTLVKPPIISSSDFQNLTIIRPQYRRFVQFNALEWLLTGLCVLSLVVACADALEGQHVGKGNALAQVKRQAQQDLMASTQK